jgi:hypothetical protein
MKPQARTVDGVVAELKAADIAAVAGEKIKRAELIDGAGKARRPTRLGRREGGASRGHADMAAEVEARRVKGAGGGGRGEVRGAGSAGGQQRGNGNAGAQRRGRAQG